MSKETKQGFDVMGITIETTTKTPDNHQDFKGLWDRFFGEDIASKVPEKISHDIICVYNEYQETQPGIYNVRATAGYKVAQKDTIRDTVPKGMHVASVLEGPYQHFGATGKIPDCIAAKWADIWRSNSTLNRAFVTDFEVYGEKAQDPLNAEMDIYLSVL